MSNYSQSMTQTDNVAPRPDRFTTRATAARTPVPRKGFAPSRDIQKGIA